MELKGELVLHSQTTFFFCVWVGKKGSGKHSIAPLFCSQQILGISVSGFWLLAKAC